ncbi:hypothetical protein OH492_24630 [Vibrio chagasii]|nr:hypothetical protein [Vibrio chagasii]
MLAKQDCHTPYHKNNRVTDEYSLGVAMRAAGQLQLYAITARLSMSLNNTPMAGTQLNVMSGNFDTAQPLGVDDGTDYCHSGRIRRIDIEGLIAHSTKVLSCCLALLPAPLLAKAFNLLSEEVATQVAIRLKPTSSLVSALNKG